MQHLIRNKSNQIENLSNSKQSYQQSLVNLPTMKSSKTIIESKSHHPLDHTWNLQYHSPEKYQHFSQISGTRITHLSREGTARNLVSNHMSCTIVLYTRAYSRSFIFLLYNVCNTNYWGIIQIWVKQDDNDEPRQVSSSAYSDDLDLWDKISPIWHPLLQYVGNNLDDHFHYSTNDILWRLCS